MLAVIKLIKIKFFLNKSVRFDGRVSDLKNLINQANQFEKNKFKLIINNILIKNGFYIFVFHPKFDKLKQITFIHIINSHTKMVCKRKE